MACLLVLHNVLLETASAAKSGGMHGPPALRSLILHKNHFLNDMHVLNQDHQNSCNFLIRSGDNVHQLDVGKLEQKLESLMLKVSILERKEKKVIILDLFCSGVTFVCYVD